MKDIKPFATTLVGSMPRSKELLELKEKLKTNPNLKEDFEKKVFEETKKVIKLLDKVGIDIVVSGELSRDNYMGYIAEKVDGINLLTTDEIKELLPDDSAFKKSLEEMDASENIMKSPVCVGKINTDTPLNIKEVENIKKLTNKPFKITLPSPYLLTRTMWVKEVTGKIYDNRAALGEDIVKLLINEIKRLSSLGVKIIQIDEPILSEVVFTKECEDTSFYWGALSEKVKVDRELRFAKKLLTPIFDELKKYDDIISALHVCRGNWTRDESVLLQGPYDRLTSVFESIGADLLTLEFSTPRAGEVEKLFDNNFLDKKIALGLGCINPRTSEIENVEKIIKLAEDTLQYLPPEKILLNPDCGFSTFSQRPLNPYDIIEKKLQVMVKASEKLREIYCD